MDYFDYQITDGLNMELIKDSIKINDSDSRQTILQDDKGIDGLDYTNWIYTID